MTPDPRALLQRLREFHGTCCDNRYVSINGDSQRCSCGLREIIAQLDALLVAEYDNHHNALTCPYCNPKGLVLVDPNAQASR